ncbi:MAG: hypothetical protein LBR41_01315, partial [Rickettsiales bacterium]|nr:hypothetical protein [Rickettsiales bacterium]
FELCTDNTSFNKQRVFCESTLARCQDQGKITLFGTATVTEKTVPATESVLRITIDEGAELAAVNAVATCYKVADTCFANACGPNPYLCKEGTKTEIVDVIRTITDDQRVKFEFVSAAVNAQDIRKFLDSQCRETIGGNKFCQMIVAADGGIDIGGRNVPNAADLRNPDNQADTFSDLYSSRFRAVTARIDTLIDAFKKKTDNQCRNTIETCAMRVCGGGSGAACYAVSTDATGTTDIRRRYGEIETGCSAIVSADNNCKFSAMDWNDRTGTINYTAQNDYFATLFPSETGDPIGAIAALNAKLTGSYSAGSMAQMKSRCEVVAKGCVRDECGVDYINCYRNRNDILGSLGTTNPGGGAEKVGGVLDRGIVIGLCLDTVKSDSVCAEYIRAEEAKTAAASMDSVWGTSVRNEWIGGADVAWNTVTDESGNVLEGSVDNVGVENIFANLIYDLEVEAQAKYNAKLTLEQNMCLTNNSEGGIRSAGAVHGGTFTWARLAGTGAVPREYSNNGLKSNNFVASNSLYGSFCAVRVTLHSNDKLIQDMLGGSSTSWSETYFAAGDAFVCGSWIPGTALEDMTEKVYEKSFNRDANRTARTWATVAGIVGGGALGGIGVNSLLKSDGLGGLLRTNEDSGEFTESDSTRCERALERAIDMNAGNQPCARRSNTIKTNDGTHDLYEPAGYSDAINHSCAGKTWREAENEMQSYLDGGYCEEQSADSSAAQRRRTTGALIGGAVSAGLGGFMANQIARDTQRAGANREAEEWLENIGDKIECWVGGAPVGRYGDTISITTQ